MCAAGRWFAVNMGTGIVSILLHNLPYNAPWVQYISFGFFILNISLFLVFLAITLARYALYPEIWHVMLKHPAQSLFLGCLPMGFASRSPLSQLWGATLTWQSDNKHDRVRLCFLGRVGNLPCLGALVGGCGGVIDMLSDNTLHRVRTTTMWRCVGSG